MTHSMTHAKTREPAAANIRNQSSMAKSAKSTSVTEKSRLATFFNIKSPQAACSGVRHPLADLIFCARSTKRNDNPFPSKIGRAHV